MGMRRPTFRHLLVGAPACVCVLCLVWMWVVGDPQPRQRPSVPLPSQVPAPSGAAPEAPPRALLLPTEGGLLLPSLSSLSPATPLTSRRLRPKKKEARLPLSRCYGTDVRNMFETEAAGGGGEPAWQLELLRNATHSVPVDVAALLGSEAEQRETRLGIRRNPFAPFTACDGAFDATWHGHGLLMHGVQLLVTGRRHRVRRQFGPQSAEAAAAVTPTKAPLDGSNVSRCTQSRCSAEDARDAVLALRRRAATERQRTAATSSSRRSDAATQSMPQPPVSYHYAMSVIMRLPWSQASRIRDEHVLWRVLKRVAYGLAVCDQEPSRPFHLPGYRHVPDAAWEVRLLPQCVVYDDRGGGGGSANGGLSGVPWIRTDGTFFDGDASMSSLANLSSRSAGGENRSPPLPVSQAPGGVLVARRNTTTAIPHSMGDSSPVATFMFIGGQRFEPFNQYHASMEPCGVAWLAWLAGAGMKTARGYLAKHMASPLRFSTPVMHYSAHYEKLNKVNVELAASILAGIHNPLTSALLEATMGSPEHNVLPSLFRGQLVLGGQADAALFRHLTVPQNGSAVCSRQDQSLHQGVAGENVERVAGENEEGERGHGDDDGHGCAATSAFDQLALPRTARHVETHVDFFYMAHWGGHSWIFGHPKFHRVIRSWAVAVRARIERQYSDIMTTTTTTKATRLSSPAMMGATTRSARLPVVPPVATVGEGKGLRMVLYDWRPRVEDRLLRRRRGIHPDDEAALLAGFRAAGLGDAHRVQWGTSRPTFRHQLEMVWRFPYIFFAEGAFMVWMLLARPNTTFITYFETTDVTGADERVPYLYHALAFLYHSFFRSATSVPSIRLIVFVREPQQTSSVGDLLSWLSHEPSSSLANKIGAFTTSDGVSSSSLSSNCTSSSGCLVILRPGGVAARVLHQRDYPFHQVDGLFLGGLPLK